MDIKKGRSRDTILHTPVNEDIIYWWSQKHTSEIVSVVSFVQGMCILPKAFKTW